MNLADDDYNLQLINTSLIATSVWEHAAVGSS